LKSVDLKEKLDTQKDDGKNHDKIVWYREKIIESEVHDFVETAQRTLKSLINPSSCLIEIKEANVFYTKLSADILRYQIECQVKKEK